MRPRPERGTFSLPRALRALALLAAAALLPACAGGAGPAAGPFPQLSAYQGREVAEVTFVGELLIPRDSLERVVTTRPSRCRLLVLPICVGRFGRDKYELDLEVLSRDVVRIQLLYRDQGYYGTRVVPTVEEVEGDEKDRVAVRFAVLPGDLVTLRSLDFEGAEAVTSDSLLLRRVPLRVGEPFKRIDFLASVDTVRNALLAEGRAYAQVLRNYQIDTIADVADVQLVAAPGPVVLVDSIIFTGQYRLSERTIRKQMAVQEGRPLTAENLSRSQRNLFDLELVRYASVEVAPESLQVTPDSAELDRDTIGSTVLVRVGEAPRYAVDMAGGYGTVDCLRARASRVDRDFLGGARRLELSGLVSKVGVTSPLDFGLEDTPLCDAFNLENAPTSIDTLIADALNYRLAADFLQPRLFGTRTSVGVNLYTERISELGLYLRRSAGAQVGATRQVARGTLASVSFNVERGNTQADDEFFCIVFEVCTRDDIAPLRENRWSNSLSLGVVRNRVRLDPFPSSGYLVRVGTDLAAGFIGSDDRYHRVLADGTVYREIRDDWVVSFRLLGGTFLSGVVGDEFIPPERRFYAGGPTTVRGYSRNALGPNVYILRIEAPDREGDRPDTSIVRSATGGTRMVVGTVELTTPSPIGGENVRMAAFLDAGQVSAPADDDTPVFNPGVRFTPGVGLRFASPLGPLRADVAYNPYDPEPGPLFEIDEFGNLANGGRPIRLRYEPESPGFLQRLRLHISIGTAF